MRPKKSGSIHSDATVLMRISWTKDPHPPLSPSLKKSLFEDEKEKERQYSSSFSLYLKNN